MRKTVEIKFKPNGKAYVFDCGAFVLEVGDYVIVETEQGYSMGVVSSGPVPVNSEKLKIPLKKVHRKAIDKDFSQLEESRALEKLGFDFCKAQTKELNLDMNLFSVDCSFDCRKLTFLYTADGRIDFRELVKRLVKQFHIKIEMRQVGIRNQAKITGGIGRCGREFCCASYMKKFDPISIRMAKNQGLSLNPTKISGVCGRLMCCLAFEEESYRNLKKGIPGIGELVKTSRGEGKVIGHNVIAKRVTIQKEDGTMMEVALDAIENDDVDIAVEEDDYGESILSDDSDLLC